MTDLWLRCKAAVFLVKVTDAPRNLSQTSRARVANGIEEVAALVIVGSVHDAGEQQQCQSQGPPSPPHLQSAPPYPPSAMLPCDNPPPGLDARALVLEGRRVVAAQGQCAGRLAAGQNRPAITCKGDAEDRRSGGTELGWLASERSSCLP